MLLRNHFLPLFEQPGGGAGDGAASGAGGGGAGAGGGGAGAGGGKGGDPFYQPYVASLDKDSLAYLDGKNYPSFGDLVKSARNSEKMATDRNVIARPDPAKLGEWEGLSVLGYDPDVAKYGAKIKPPKQPNDAKHDEGLFDTIIKSGHKRFVPPAMLEGVAQDISDAVNARLSEMASQGQKATQELEASMRKEWGQNYDANLELARRAFKAFGIGADDSGELEKVMGSVRLQKLGYDLGKKLGEGNLVNNDGQGAAGTTPAGAAAELRRLEADADFMKVFAESRHPQHADYKAKWQRLAEIAAKDPKNLNPQRRR